ncbi:DUF5753 domain-containing protein [Streptomyces sp. ID05-26A]|nr:DUF5753 domain-containing protein [Streptomyces sp. ID05-26A]
MPKRVSTARGREFGAGVRAALNQAGLTSRAAAEIMDWDEGKLSNVINGKVAITQLEAAVLLGACRIAADETMHLLSLHPGTHMRNWWQQHGTCAPIRHRTFNENLASAETLVDWQTHTVPLLLQTNDYMREAVRASSTAPAVELSQRVRERLVTQQLLQRGVKCTFYVHELALHLRVGGPEVYAAQLLHILFMANRPRIVVRVLPASLGAHAGMAGPFTRLTFTAHEPLVWVETENSSIIAEAKDTVSGYEEVIRSLNENSLDEVESKELILHLHERIER